MKKTILLSLLACFITLQATDNTESQPDEQLPYSKVTLLEDAHGEFKVQPDTIVDPNFQQLSDEKSLLLWLIRVKRILAQQSIDQRIQEAIINHAQEQNQKLEELSSENKALQERVAKLEELNSTFKALATRIAQSEYRKNSEGIVGG